MSAESGWLGIAVGISVGILGWVVGLGELIWPQHPQWVLLFITVVVAILSAAILNRQDHRSTGGART